MAMTVRTTGTTTTSTTTVNSTVVNSVVQQTNLNEKVTIDILFTGDETIYHPANMKFESFDTTPFPATGNSGRDFIENDTPNFIVRVYFATEQFIAEIRNDSDKYAKYQAYRDDLNTTPTEKLFISVYRRDTDTLYGVMYPESATVKSTYMDFVFNVPEGMILEDCAMEVNTSIITLKTALQMYKSITSASQSQLAQANQNLTAVLNLLN